MNIKEVKDIANAALYESYLLYPYRQSAIKNRQRWTIGVVYPQEYSEANNSIEPWTMQTECLGMGGANTTFDLYVRFLHLLVRTVKRTETTGSCTQDQGGILPAGERSIASCFADEPREEAMEREISILSLPLHDLLEHTYILDFAFPGTSIVEDLATASHLTIMREQQPLKGTVAIAAKRINTESFKLTVQIMNNTPETGTIANLHNILLHSFISSHTILQIHQGTFTSLVNPPEAVLSVTQQCENLHTWPIPVGSKDTSDFMLSSPIILYDYPQIAPENPGSLFDSTEIDKRLMLRIMALTDDKKAKICQGNIRACEMPQHTESLTLKAFMKLHDTLRSMRPDCHRTLLENQGSP
jgi:hypothetical protein